MLHDISACRTHLYRLLLLPSEKDASISACRFHDWSQSIAFFKIQSRTLNTNLFYRTWKNPGACPVTLNLLQVKIARLNWTHHILIGWEEYGRILAQSKVWLIFFWHFWQDANRERQRTFNFVGDLIWVRTQVVCDRIKTQNKT